MWVKRSGRVSKWSDPPLGSEMVSGSKLYLSVRYSFRVVRPEEQGPRMPISIRIIFLKGWFVCVC